MQRTLLRRTQNILRDVKAAAELRSALSVLPYEQRLGFLRALRQELLDNEPQIMEANRLDCNAFAQQQHSAFPTRPPQSATDARILQGPNRPGCTPTEAPYHKGNRWGVHTELSPLRIMKLLVGIDDLLRMPDPIASLTAEKKTHLTHGSHFCASREIIVQDVTVPIGCVGVLSRYRPRMTLDAVAMCLFSGNAVLIDGGAALMHTNHALMASVRQALAIADIPSASVVHVEANKVDPDHSASWLRASDCVDLAIVCGSEKLYRYAASCTAIPLLRAVGRSCSLYVDKSADFQTALEIVLNAKFQRPGATNAINTLIIHEAYPQFAELLQALKDRGALLVGDQPAQALAPSCISENATEEVYKGLSEGFSDYHRVLCVRTVRDLMQVVYFLDLFGSKQTDGIIATDEDTIVKYCRCVDSAVVLVNASTRLSSGQALGRGVDLAIATSKVHFRGPLTISALTTKKVVVRCNEPGGALRL